MGLIIKKIIIIFGVFVLIGGVYADSDKPNVSQDPPALEQDNPELQPEFPSPYMVEIPIKDESSRLRKQGFANGLYLILIRTSNDPQVVNLSNIKEALNKSQVYVKEFNYLTKNVAPERKALFLQISFDAGAISHLLKRSSQTAWVKSKPQVLFWLAKEYGRDRSLINEHNSEVLLNLVKEKSQELKVPAVFPSWDMQDIGLVKSHDVCSYNLSAIKSASLRYGVPWIVIACIKQPMIGGVWSSQWLLVHGEDRKYFSFSGINANTLISQAVATIANNIGDVEKPIARRDSAVMMRVSNISGLEEYQELVKYLRTFEKVVSKVDLVSLNAQNVELKVAVVGGEKSLLKILSMQNRLIPNHEVSTDSASVATELNYRWVLSKHESTKAAST